jgi:hypothetical protein
MEVEERLFGAATAVPMPGFSSVLIRKHDPPPLDRRRSF